MKNAVLIFPAVALAACANETTPVSETPAPSVEEGSVSNDCPVIESRNWTAWVDAEPPGPARLHIRGEVDMPTPGYKASWREGIADRAMPPGVHFHLDFAAPDGMVAQVITTDEVAYEGEATYPAYRVIYVHCGDEKLAEIGEVPIAQ